MPTSRYSARYSAKHSPCTYPALRDMPDMCLCRAAHAAMSFSSVTESVYRVAMLCVIPLPIPA